MREGLQLSLDNNVRTFQIVIDQAITNAENTAQRPGFSHYAERLIANPQDAEALSWLKKDH